MRPISKNPSAYFLATPMVDWYFQRFPEHREVIRRIEVGNMPNNEPTKLTLASSIAARNQGQPKLLDLVRNTLRPENDDF